MEGFGIKEGDRSDSGRSETEWREQRKRASERERGRAWQWDVSQSDGQELCYCIFKGPRSPNSLTMG